MPIVLPPPTLLGSRSTHVDGVGVRPKDSVSPLVERKAMPPARGKFADALRQADSTAERGIEELPSVNDEVQPSSTEERHGPSNYVSMHAEPAAEEPTKSGAQAEYTSSPSSEPSGGGESLAQVVENTQPVNHAMLRGDHNLSLKQPIPAKGINVDPAKAVVQHITESVTPTQSASAQASDGRITQSAGIINAAAVNDATGSASSNVTPVAQEQPTEARLAVAHPATTVSQIRPRDVTTVPASPAELQFDSGSRPAELDPRRVPARLATVAPAQVTTTSGSDQTPRRDPKGRSAEQATSTAPARVEVQPQPTTPAVARAMQVNAAVRAEFALTQTTASDQPAANPAPSSHASLQTLLAPSLHSKSDNLAQQLPGLSTPIEDSPLAGQVVRGLFAMVNQRGGTMNLRLDPPDLGQLRIQMTVARGMVTADFHPSTLQAHELLERNLAALRSTLEGQGLTVDRLNVHGAMPSGQPQMTRDDTNANHSHQHRQHHDAAGGESRGRRDGQSQQEFHREYAFADFQNLLNELDQFALR